MYRRGAFQILALVLVVLVGSAVAQQITGTQLLVSGAGPHAIGGAPNANRQVLVTGTFSPPGGAALVGFYYDTTIVSPAGATDMYGFNFSPSFTKGTTGAHGDVSGFLVGAPAINSGGGAVVNNASSLKIVGAPTGGVNNYALLVGGGATLLGGTLWVRGDAKFDGNIAAKYQDVAEWLKSDAVLPPATVVVIDPREQDRVRISAEAYDTRVAGVVSPRPGLLLGEAGEDKTKVAHSGRVRVKVDDRYGPIATGDLLVTSPTPGHAMRSEPVNVGGAAMHRPGTLIGKALEPLNEGVGEVLILLTLQ